MERKKDRSRRGGQLLLEILVAVGVAAIIAVLAAQLGLIGLQSSQSSADKDVSLGIVDETFEGVRSIAAEQWQNIYNLAHDGTIYYPLQSSGKWTIVQGTGSSTENGINYNIAVSFQHVCRDSSTDNITGVSDSNGSSTTACSASGGSYDGSTEKINVTVSWPNAPSVSSSEYLPRWRNIVCSQTSWLTTSTAAATCPGSTYETSTGITASSSIQICSGC